MASVEERTMDSATAQIGVSSADVRKLLEEEARNMRQARRVYRLILTTYALAAATFVLYQFVTNRTQRDYQTEVVKRFAVPDGGSSPDGQSVEIHDRIKGFQSKPPDHQTSTASPLLHPLLTIESPPNEKALTLDLHRMPWGYVLLICAVGWAVFAGSRRALRAQKQAATVLSVLKDPLAAGPLAECLAIDDRQIRYVTENALVRLLPQLRADHGQQLNDEQHRYLNRVLPGRNVELALAILNAYEQVGDHRDLLSVQTLAAGRGKSARRFEVREAARRCLPYLHKNAETLRAAQTYLRAAEASHEEESLLRIAEEARTVDPRLLLRPRDS
jgi:hypothetical protein